jgi:hypothetical protein
VPSPPLDPAARPRPEAAATLGPGDRAAQQAQALGLTERVLVALAVAVFGGAIAGDARCQATLAGRERPGSPTTAAPGSTRAAGLRAWHRAVGANALVQRRERVRSSAWTHLRRIGALAAHALAEVVGAREARCAAASALPASANRHTATTLPAAACMAPARRRGPRARRAAVVAQIVELPQGVACGNGHSDQGCDPTCLPHVHGQSTELVAARRGGNRALASSSYHALRGPMSVPRAAPG